MAALDSFTQPFSTHEVANQAPPLEDLDLFSTNVPLVEALDREGAGWARERCAEVGRVWGGEPLRTWGPQANEHPPKLRTHDRFGHRIDEVEFHPSWHWLMRTSVGWGLHGTPWVAEAGSGAHVARAAGFYLVNLLENGHCCPIS